MPDSVYGRLTDKKFAKENYPVMKVVSVAARGFQIRLFSHITLTDVQQGAKFSIRSSPFPCVSCSFLVQRIRSCIQQTFSRIEQTLLKGTVPPTHDGVVAPADGPGRGSYDSNVLLKATLPPTHEDEVALR